MRSVAGRLEVERGAADIAADGDRAGNREHMAEKRRRRRLAVGAGDGDEAGAALRLAPQKLDVADDLDFRRPCQLNDRMRRGMRQRNAGREHQGSRAAPTANAPAGSPSRRALPPSRAPPPCRPRRRRRRPAGDRRAHGRKPASRQSEDADRSSVEMRERDQAPTSASASRGRSARARPRRSRSGSPPAAPSSRAARNDGGSAPCGRRAGRSS